MKKTLNEKEICFILCSNNALYTEECIYYIAHLNVPEGYEINVLAIEDAVSMASGYNEGMQASHAKYKVYLHQDTFIVNRNFIQDFLDVFRQDEEIGMIGMVGAPQLPASGVMWEAPRCGALYTWRVSDTVESWLGEDELTQVEVIDGFLMITQYDIPWREDLFDGWDFYDCSQSKEFARHGYKVVVPELGKPWCIHDSGSVSLMHYDKACAKFLKEYRDEIPALQQQDSCRATVVVTAHNQKEILSDTLAWLADAEGIGNIIVVDNGSEDGTADWLSMQPYEYLWFDEGAQGYGKLWNAVLENFETEDCIIFQQAGVFPDKRCLRELLEALRVEGIGIANPDVCDYEKDGNGIERRESARGYMASRQKYPARKAFRKTLVGDWRIWAISKDTILQNGLFNEELKLPHDVLTDYTLRLLRNGYTHAMCKEAYAKVCFQHFEQIYTVTMPGQWEQEDRMHMKAVWGMNYFNLKPNALLVNSIQEEKESAFKVLEVGCDLGATLFAIKERYPNCETFGIDINRAAVEIAGHITNVRYGNIDDLAIPFREKFDYIIFGDVLEHLRHPEEVVRMCRDLLHENGCIIASIPNVMHISVLEQLIDGRFHYSDVGLLDRTHIHLFTYYEIMELFQGAAYEIEDMSRTVFEMSEREKALTKILLQLSDHTEAWMYEAFQYTVRARKR